MSIVLTCNSNVCHYQGICKWYIQWAIKTFDEILLGKEAKKTQND